MKKMRRDEEDRRVKGGIPFSHLTNFNPLISYHQTFATNSSVTKLFIFQPRASIQAELKRWRTKYTYTRQIMYKTHLNNDDSVQNYWQKLYSSHNTGYLTSTQQCSTTLFC